MRIVDVVKSSAAAIERAPGRTALMLLAMAIGVASVVVLTSLGEGARRFVTGEFASLGTNLVIVIPGRSETTGGAPALVVGQTPRDLTLDDALSLKRHYAVEYVAPVVVGSGGAAYAGLEREVPILGSTSELLEVRNWRMSRGQFLPDADPRRAASVCVVGGKVASELFGNKNPVGEWLRIGDWRCRVIGELASEGRSIGIDTQELVIVPVASAQSLFNAPSLFRILVQARSRESLPSVKRFVLRAIADRHQGEEDITAITQDAVLSTFDRIFGALTMTVAGIAAISLLVAGVLIMNVMLISVSQRTAEIGLLKAVGASGRQVITLFLTEAVLLASIGALIGFVVGLGGNWAIVQLYPKLPIGVPAWAAIAAIAVAVSSGLVFGILPARRAARLDPVIALSRR